ncbi:MAG: FAD:protein FMN transferase [Thermodesulfobacteriota bacterium]
MERDFNHLGYDKSLDRRSFLKLSGLIGLGAASAVLAPMGAEAVKFDRKRHKVSSTRLAMGTVVSLTLIHESRDEAQDALGRAFEEMDRLSGLLNRYDGSTAVGCLNHEGRLTASPPEVREVVLRALHYHGLTGGAFDITIKPLVDLFKERYENGQSIDIPQASLDRVLGLVDAGAVQVRDQEIRFGRPGMGLTLDGIAKGYIVDRVSEYLVKNGIRNHLVNAGGDIRTSGSRMDGKPWAVAIEDPEKRGEYPDILHMKDGAVATSGNYEIYFDREKMVHHIVDPRTGASPRLSTSVSVRAHKAMDADALATGLFVMKPVEGSRLVESLSGMDALVIARSGRQWSSGGWKSEAR